MACGAGYDQGTFTELIYLNRLDHAVSLSTTEFGSTFGMICNSLDVAYDTFGEVRDESGMVYPVVHQFDRFGELQRDLNRRMPLDPQLLVSNSTDACARRCVMSRVGGVCSHHRDGRRGPYDAIVHTRSRTLSTTASWRNAPVAPLARRQVEGDAVLAVLRVPCGESRFSSLMERSFLKSSADGLSRPCFT